MAHNVSNDGVNPWLVRHHAPLLKLVAEITADGVAIALNEQIAVIIGSDLKTCLEKA